MGKQRSRQQPSKHKVQVKHKRAAASSGSGQDGTMATAQAGADASGTSAPVAGAQSDMPVYGLNNLGNTCFYNSALQVLLAVPALRDFCILPQPGGQLKKGPLGRALQELVQTVYGQRDVSTQDTKSAKLSRKGGAPVFSPSRLLAAICKIAPIFKGGQQQDSHELMRCLVEGLHAEEQRALEQLRKEGDDARRAEGEADGAPPSLRGEFFMEGVFGGRLASHVACSECGRESVTLETFYDLSLPIPAGLPQPQSLEDAKHKRQKGKQEPGQGTGPAEPATPQAAQLSTKQRKKAEREARKKAQQLDRRRQQKWGAAGAEAESATARPGAGGAQSDDVSAASGPAAIEEPKLRGGSGLQSASAPSLGSGSESSSGTSAQTIGNAVPQGPSCWQGGGARGAEEPSLASLGSAASLASSTETLSAASMARADLLCESASSAESPFAPAAGHNSPGIPPSRLTGSYVSRDANTLTPDQTVTMAGAADIPSAKSGTPRSTAAAPAGRFGAPLGQCVQRQVARQHAEERAGELQRLSEQLRSASLAPDAKSGNRPGQGSTLVEREAAANGDDAASTDSSTEGDAASDQVVPVREGVADNTLNVVGSLAGGFADTGSSSAQSSAAFTMTSSSLVGSMSSAGAGPAAPQQAGSNGARLDPVPETAGPALPALATHDAAAGYVLERLQQSVSAPADQQQPVSLPGTGADAGRHEDVEREDAGKGEEALYADLDALEEEASGLGDVSEDCEVDAESLQGQRLHLGEQRGVPSPAQAAQAEEPSGTPAEPRPEEPVEAGEEEMGALGSLFEEGNPALATCEEECQPLNVNEEWDVPAAPEQASQEATLEGCLAAFFARETVTWECPAETAERKRAAEAARSGTPDGASQGLTASTSLAASSIGTPQLLKRRSVSFSEEAPRVKLVPGSAEQRGTNFARALQGRTPFCRPLKAGRAYYLLTAEVDELSHDKLHLGLQAQDETEETVSALAEVHAINNSITFGSVPIAPIDDAEDEEEQARVKGQAQALLDCAADLVAQGGLQSAVDLLQDGTELRRCSSAGAGSDTWQVVGTVPATESGSPGGTWEHPAQSTSSPRDSGPSELISTGSLWGMSYPGSGEALSARGGLRSPSLLSRFSSFASAGGGGEGIPEGHNEGASSSSGGEEASSAAASEEPGPSPLNGAVRARRETEPRSIPAEVLPEKVTGRDSPPALQPPTPDPSGRGVPTQDLDGPEADCAFAKKLGGLALGNDAANGHHAAGGVPNGLPNGAHAALEAAQSPSSAKGAEGISMANGHHSANVQDGAPHASNSSKGRAEPEQVAAGTLQNGANLDSGSRRSEQTREEGIALSGASVSSSRSRHEPSDTIRAALRAGLRVHIDSNANIGNTIGHGAGQCSSGEVCTPADAPMPPRETAGAANGTTAGDAAAAGAAETERLLASLPHTAHPSSSSPEAGAASGEAAGTGEEGKDGASGGAWARSPGRSRSAGSVERGILRRSAALTVQREAVKGYLIHRAPEVLTCHLKRFQQDARGRLRKIQGSIPFLRDLDLTRFCDPKGMDAGGARYVLVGVVEHRGSLLASGHYTSFSARHPAWGVPSPHPQQDERSGSPSNTPPAEARNGSSSTAAAESSSEQAGHAGADAREAGGCCGAGGYAGAARAAAQKLGDPSALQWFRQSDAHVTRVPWETVAAAEAYILVFVRVK